MSKLASGISRLVDALYIAPVQRLVGPQTFRYGAVGALNLGFGVVLYWFLYHFVLRESDTEILGMVTISAPILAFLINFVVTFFSGFWLSRNVAFAGRRELHGALQLLRYTAVVALNIAINYFGLKLLVGLLGFYPTPSYMALQVLTVVVSYLSSRFFVFR